MENTKSAEYLSKATGNCFYLPLFVCSVILLLTGNFTGELYLKISGILSLILAPLGFWLSRKFLWQFIFIHGILSIFASIYFFVCLVFIVVNEGFKMDLISVVFAVIAFGVLSKVMIEAALKRKRFINIFKERES